jgi:hypothetical protein
MDALFRRLASVSRRAVEIVNGSPAMIYPMDRIGVNTKPQRSPNRSPFLSVICLYRDSDNRDRIASQPMIPGAGAQMLNRSPRISASIRLPETPTIKSGDMIDDAGDWYEITEIHPDGVGGAMLTLAAAKPVGVPNA